MQQLNECDYIQKSLIQFLNATTCKDNLIKWWVKILTNEMKHSSWIITVMKCNVIEKKWYEMECDEDELVVFIGIKCT